MNLRNLFKRQTPAPEGALYESVRDNMVEIQAYARSHGGDVELLSVDDDGNVTIRFHGACRGCPLSGITLKLGIEEQLKLRIPGVRKVLAG